MQILFGGTNSVLPNSTIPCKIKIGQLKNFESNISYFSQNKEGEMYLVG